MRQDFRDRAEDGVMDKQVRGVPYQPAEQTPKQTLTHLTASICVKAERQNIFKSIMLLRDWREANMWKPTCASWCTR